ncbi:MAG: four helix bundle protein, partial [Muribaculaceae bacterium]|nr:four helix bundle protein [Muribaculaceae bacterium]
MKTSDFKDLDVWKLSMDFACDIYDLIKLLPQEEKFGLCDQLRRAAISV